MTESTNGHGAAHAIRLTIPAKPEYITLGRLALTGLARLRPLAPDVLGDMKLALTEACTNSVRHAYDGSEGVVDILYELHADKLIVEVTDEGEGFDHEAAGTGDADDLTEGGLGIAIIEALTDALEIGPRDGGGSKIRFVKRLDG